MRAWASYVNDSEPYKTYKSNCLRAEGDSLNAIKYSYRSEVRRAIAILIERLTIVNTKTIIIYFFYFLLLLWAIANL